MSPIVVESPEPTVEPVPVAATVEPAEVACSVEPHVIECIVAPVQPEGSP